MPFQKGQSGNPNGRPPKSRALTEILERGGSKTVEIDGKHVSGKRLVSMYIWELATTGKVQFEGRELRVSSVREWADIVKWIYSHIDGPPKGEIDITSGGEKLSGDSKERDRALSTLADAIREGLLGEGTDGSSDMDATEQTTVASTPDEG